MQKLQTLKGFRDFLPEQARKRQFVIDTLRKVFESYGFEPLETPALEYEEVLMGKYGDEGDKLMYKFEDNGGRKVALRYDQTVPLARVVAQYQNELPMPFKRYQIQPVYRAENTQKGRFREFLQCDADIVGTSSKIADVEMLTLAFNAYKSLGLDVLIKVNDRKLLAKISIDALSSIDKLNKIGEEGVKAELISKGASVGEADKMLADVKALKASVELKEIIKDYEDRGYPSDSIQFDQTLVRGLDYYTGLIFEVVLKSNPVSSSLCGGGRYDNLIGMFAGKQIPATGFAIGFDRTLEAMEELKLFPENLSTAKVLVTIFSSELAKKSVKISSDLRESGVATELYSDDTTKLDKQLKYANQKGIPFVLVIGPDEAQKDLVTLKNMQSGDQETIKLIDLIDKLI